MIRRGLRCTVIGEAVGFGALCDHRARGEDTTGADRQPRRHWSGTPVPVHFVLIHPAHPAGSWEGARFGSAPTCTPGLSRAVGCLQASAGLRRVSIRHLGAVRKLPPRATALAVGLESAQGQLERVHDPYAFVVLEGEW